MTTVARNDAIAAPIQAAACECFSASIPKMMGPAIEPV